MSNINITDRLTFLAKSFDVFETDKDAMSEKAKQLEDLGFTVTPVRASNGVILALLGKKVKDAERNRFTKRVCVSVDVFGAMIGADPTENKICLQWMLNTFTRMLKDDATITAAIRFADEDLPQALTYLTLFEANKRKRKFKELSSNSYILKDIGDITDINQYKSLGQLFDAVDPFIERNPSQMEKLLQRYVDSGQALIPVRDRKFTLFIPKTTDANVLFDNYANWCTAKKGNTMFKRYTEQDKKPNGKNSDIYIIINNDFFTGTSDEMYQIHFETNQIKDRRNQSNVNIFENVLNVSEGLSNFFYEELMTMAKTCKDSLDDNKYLNYLIQFGFTESLFDFMDGDISEIRFMKREIPKLPDLSKFTLVDHFIITDAGLVEVHPSIGKLTKIELLSLSNNRIKSLPREIGNLKNVNMINLVGNPLTDIPEDIKYLDKTNGGSLYRIAVSKNEIGEENYQKLKRLLPTTVIAC